MRRRRLFLICCVALMIYAAMISVAGATTNIRVHLATVSGNAELAIVQGEYQLVGSSLSVGSTVVTAGDRVTIRRSGSTITVLVNNQEAFSGIGNVSLTAASAGEDNIFRYSGVRYRGNLICYSTTGYLVNTLNIDDYLYGVVGREIGASAPFEAIKAQSVASRSYAFAMMGGTYYDVTNSTSSQVYGGYEAEIEASNANVIRAVDETAGEIMYYNDEPVIAYFHAHSGGHTENNENVWGGAARDYLRGVTSSYDSYGTAYNSWTVTYTPAEMVELAEAQLSRTGKSGSIGDFVELRVSASGDSGSSASGRVLRAEIVGTSGSVVAERDAIRTMLGLRSTLFTVSGGGVASAVEDEVYVVNSTGVVAKRSWRDLVAISGEKITQILGELVNPSVSTADGTYAFSGSASSDGNVVITGKGYGHGVGMSQYGAMGMANAGYTYREILTHYYGGSNSNNLRFVVE